mmetsp:Transcript_19684/g.75515  ORF Transcript_19684/g.75515 Transcript_19684/m.75515 type:complete len:347 (+) Transcript_19684:119-1159(+)|eukprot:CAMPEP_0114618408 /NCGR_PEP_ID=MMETSP0168-20121206/7687_1 /TAXON_ID=95228 ORGANISM="Vannella sp., Strain DIVA3 517/6/12" /NCGR_SAMPLE_ID=MMETSP0168 /ASSEMBLY_ACC=CAM_ASM_000044 /LENGTH=346 /DNA_ID=CAMNT_0001829553 /DNA_START=68 /DNA_END=1108 /DNA_ORIENTATION=+
MFSTGTDKLNPNKDAVVGQPPGSQISCLEWSPKANLLVAGAWDNTVSCYEVSAQGTSTPKARSSFEQPVLCTAWSGDGSKVFVGGCSNKVMCWDLAANQSTQVAQHQAPVQDCFWVPELGNGCLVTCSWDKTVQYWDGRQGKPIHSTDTGHKVWCMDVKHPVLALGLSNRHIQIYNLSNPGQLYQDIESPLKNQTRTINVFPDKTGFAVGSIEGRVAIHHINRADVKKNFAFKCHRNNQTQPNEVYAVNSIRFHPVFGTFSTAGSDGSYHFWDKDSKQRLKQFQRSCAPISATAFNANGTIFAYAVSYDWSKGFQYAEHPDYKANSIFLHGVQEEEMKRRDRSLPK